jgi:hypothetical protein
MTEMTPLLNRGSVQILVGFCYARVRVALLCSAMQLLFWQPLYTTMCNDKCTMTAALMDR